ncbi:tRNA (adenosine(37)-N6)-threonylcarbamoyltransferase complex transferase subunit TsaD [Candidatus Peregrinibacteria bacterium]|nr:tRNA (adenosine(37)-N6)-threonylcarbamoyltransferase complex transferase subunit TsaD [Candidatus Peregrinibacteria bacterium]
MKILGIETSCDETAAAVVENGVKVLSNVIASSVDLHAKTGGVVPEVAAREHIRQITPVVDQAMEEANVGWDDIDAIAVTHAPGLVASLLIGINTAQTLSYIYKKPLIPIHHIAGHIYANFLERDEKPAFPILVLTVSGGHNELVLLKGHYQFEVIGETLDDAAGEAFDKVARLLGLGFPGGPAIAKAAEKGNSKAIDFPRPMLDEKNKYNFSFSGLKTAVRTHITDITEGRDNDPGLQDNTINDIAASFQAAVIDVLSDKLVSAAREFGVKEVYLAGGVSANQLLRQTVSDKLKGKILLIYPKQLIYCTDNAAMIAGAAYFCPRKVDFRKIEAHSQFPLET